MHATRPLYSPGVFPPGRAARAHAIRGLRPLAVAVLLVCSAVQAHAQALPNGATVINGTAGINTFSNGLQVVNSPGAIIHWDSFSIGNGRTVRFDQLTSQSAVLNRVTGNAHSEILGALQSNGRVFLLNPNGILFGAGARVDVAGLLASTLDISNEDFLAGNYRFSCFNATVCESGVDTLNPYNNRIVLEDGSQITTRTAGEGGQVWLIARDRITSEKGSKIEAPGGQVMAAAAREVTITSPALGNMTFTLTGATGSRIDLEGDIDVPRGAAGFFADTIRLAGSVAARSDVGAAGQIVARATSDIRIDGDARLDVSGNPGADAGAVRLVATRQLLVHPNAEIAADGGAPTAQHASPNGGLIELDAYQVSLPWTADATTLGGSPWRRGQSAQIHAYATGAADGDLSRHGDVRVTERGSFELVKTEFPTLPESTNGTPQVLAQVDGSVLAVSSSADGLWARVIRPDGTLAGDAVSLLAPPAPGRSYSLQSERLLTLSQGGWLYVVALNEYGMPPSSGEGAPRIGPTRGQVSVISASGQLLQRIVVDDVPYSFVEGVWATRGGGFVAPQGAAGAAGAVTYYTAAGQVDTAATAATAGARPPALQTPSGGSEALQYYRLVSFDPQLEFTHDSPRVLRNTSTGEVIWTGEGATLLQGRFAPGLVVVDRVDLSSGYYEGRSDVYTTTGELVYEGLARRGSVGQTHYGDLWLPLGSDRLFVEHSNTVYAAQSINDVRTTSMAFYARQPVAMPFAAQTAAAAVVTPFVLASVPGQGNGVLDGGGGVIPPVEPPVIPPVTPATPPVASAPPPLLELPPPPVLSAIRPTPPAAGRAPVGVPASVVTAPNPQDEAEDSPGNRELLQAARDVVQDALGEKGLAKFNAAESARERGAVLQEAAYAQAVGPELYAATESMGQPMRQALFTGMGQLQQLGFMDGGTDLSEGLNKALFVKREGGLNADGTPGPARTRLEVAMLMLETELAQAQTVGERKRVQNKLTREMIVAARQEEGETVDEDEEVVIVNNNGETSRITSDGDVVRD
ncbi:MAG: filamentous hemagglutinin N-terminal domain-containing protein [Polaromonas sp.]|nr:filamentous hemagglutinin N-terminal domain-containing protein [Polaromonas sp.]